MAVPVHLFSLYEIAHLVASRIKDGTAFNEKLHESLSADMLPLPPGPRTDAPVVAVDGLSDRRAFLPGGERPVYFAYRRENARAVVFIEREPPQRQYL
jgi:hypothetical protein